METDKDEHILSWLPKEYVGLAVSAGGLLILIGAILNWDWVLQGDGRIMNIAWVSDQFGRNVARILVEVHGILIILAGLLLFWVMKL